MDRIKSFFSKYLYTSLLFIYLIIIALLLNNGNLYMWQAILIYLSIWSLIAIFNILAKTKKSVWITILLSLFIAFEAYFGYKYRSIISIGVIASVFETNTNETREFFKDALLIGILCLAMTLFLIFKSQKELKASKLSKKWSLIYLCWFLFSCIPSVFYFNLKGNENAITDFKQKALLFIHPKTSYITPIVYSDIVGILAYIDEKLRFRNFIQTERVLPEGITIKADTAGIPKIYLIIGESSYRKHYSLYGHEVKTTPFLDSLYQSGNLNFDYYQGISAASITREALKRMLTFATPLDDESYYQEKNLIDLAKMAGYETVWISNQEKVGLHDSYVGFIASCADISYFSESFSNPYERDDLNLIKLIENNYKKDKKQLFVVHLMGNHLRYFERYDDIDANAVPANQVSNEYIDYDRSIHHTDRVLRNIFYSTQKDTSSVLLYSSDHGEIVNVGHGFVGHGPAQFEIPYFTITNKNKSVKPIISKYIDDQTNLINNSSTIYAICQMMGFEISDKLIEQTIQDGKYILHSDYKKYLFEEIQKEKMDY